jgi:hypothetical protein
MENGLTLGITTIGDLLLRNRISETDRGKALEEISLTIPDYQRPYKWTAKNANQLLDDIEEAMNDNKEKYRVGTLILHKDEYGRYNIVDGQQRTITFSLLLDCLGQGPIAFLDQSVSGSQYNLHNILNNHALEHQVSFSVPLQVIRQVLPDIEVLPQRYQFDEQCCYDDDGHIGMCFDGLLYFFQDMGH